MTNIIKKTEKIQKIGRKLNLAGITQEKGRLTALKCVPVKNEREYISNYKYWLCICDHNNVVFREFIIEHIEEVTAIAYNTFEETASYLVNDFSDKTILRFKNAKDIKLFSNAINKNFKSAFLDLVKYILILNKEEKYKMLFNIINESGNKIVLPKVSITRSQYFSTNYTSSCGCIRKEKLKQISFSNQGEIVSSSIQNISKKYNISRDLIQRRTRKKKENALHKENEGANEISLEQIILGNGSRKNESQAYLMAEAISSFIRKSAMPFENICIQSGLTSKEEKVLYYRLICNPVWKLQEIADFPDFRSSREWIRRIELEGLKKIFKTFNLISN